MKDDAGLQNGDVDHVSTRGRQRRRCIGAGFDTAPFGLGLVPLDEPVTEVLHQEGQEDAGHEDGCCGGLVGQFAKALILEHEAGVCVELGLTASVPSQPKKGRGGFGGVVMIDGGIVTHMNKSCRDDDACAKLPQDSEDGMRRRDIRSHEDRGEDTNGAGHQHDEEQADAETDVVVPIDAFAAVFLFFPGAANAVSCEVG